MSDSESDIEIRSALAKKPRKDPPPKTFTQELLVAKEKTKTKESSNSNETKKPTTKEMVTEALKELHTRKGVSLYAIKKYINEKYSVDVAKSGFYIKKYLKTAVEKGVLIQTKGIGVSGSFKLAPVKKKTSKKQKKKTEKSPDESSDTKKDDKPKAKKPKLAVSAKEMMKTEKKLKITKPTKAAPLPKEKESKKEKVTNKEDSKKVKKKPLVKKAGKENKMAKEKDSDLHMTKMAKEVKKAAGKRKSLARRKSLGSIIKPPKMKPKSRA